MSRRPWAPAVVAAVAVAAAVAGCGLPTESAPRAIKPDTVPYNLLGDSDTDAPVPPAGADVRAVTVYLVREDDGKLLLRPVNRQLATPVNLDTLVANLMAGGTTRSEKSLELANLIPGKELVGIIPPKGDSDLAVTTTLQVTGDFFDRLPRGVGRRLAIAQIVYTVTGFNPGDRRPATFVRFTVNGEARKVPTASGQTQPLVSRDDFAEFDPDAPLTTSTSGGLPNLLPSTTTTPS